MKFNNQPVVDPKVVLPYYSKRKIISDTLQLCNGQEFRFINGYGLGHFLSTQDISNEIVEVNYEVKTANVKIINKLCLEYPTMSGTRLFVYRTAEEKYLLNDYINIRDYNVIADKSVSTSSDVLQFFVMETEGVPLTLEEVIDDFLAQHLISLEYEAQEITPYDVGLQGKTVFEALDLLCSAYGLLWSYNRYLNTVRVFNIGVENSSGPSTPTSGVYFNKINNIHWEALNNTISDISVHFPIYKYRQKTILEYKARKDNTSAAGHTLNVYCPYQPAFVKNDGSTRNGDKLDDVQDIIAENIEGINSTVPLVEKHHFEFPPKPLSLSEIHGDWGYGRRSILKYIDYPYIKVPNYSPDTRYAWNWIGYLAHTYSTESTSTGPTTYQFVAIPSIGLDGRIPNGMQLVHNIYKWNYGEIGWVVRVEWDCENNRWIALQQQYECPPDDPENEELPPVEEPIESGRIPGFGELDPEDTEE